MFNRRDTDRRAEDQTRAQEPRSGSAMIGPSICIEGSISGSEDLLIEGELRGKVRLPTNRLTIGKNGRVFADVYANQACVEGLMDGHLVVKEALEILSTARIEGTITAPRISLKEGARFTGTIDMDPAAAALKTPFEGKEDSVTPSPNAQDADEARISAKPVERRKHRKTRKT